MAGFNLRVNSTFQPFSFERYLKPYQMYGEEFNKQEEAYANAASEAELIGSLIDKQDERDKDLSDLYTQYMGALDEASGELSKRGLSPRGRKKLYELSQRYNREIAPIKTASDARKADREKYKALYAKDPSLMSSSSPMTASLSDYMNGNEPMRVDVYGSDIRDRSMKQAAAASKRMHLDPEYYKILGDQYYRIKQESGYNSDDMNRFIRDISSIPEVGSMIGYILDSSGVPTLSTEDQGKALKYAVEGALAGFTGDVKYDHIANRGFDVSAGNGGDSTPPVIPRHWRSIPATDVSKFNTEEAAKDIAFLKEMMADPSKILKEDKTNSKFPAFSTYSKLIPSIKPNEERLKTISKRYGLDLKWDVNEMDGNKTITTNFEDVYKDIESEIAKSAIRSNSYVLDMTDASLMAKILKENSAVVSETTGKSGIYRLDDNQVKSKNQIPYESISKYMNDKAILSYKPGLGIVLIGEDDSRNVESFVLDPEVVSGETVKIDRGNGKPGIINKYQNIMNTIDTAIEAKDEATVEDLINGFMNNLYYQFNTISKVQGRTLSASEEKIQ